jgi:hypothetical protein
VSRPAGAGVPPAGAAPRARSCRGTPPAGEQIGRESQDQSGVNPVGFGRNPAAAAKGDQAVGVNPHNRNGALAPPRQQRPLPAAGWLRGDQAGINPLQPGADCPAGVGDPFGFAPSAQIEDSTDRARVSKHRPRQPACRSSLPSPQSLDSLVGMPDCDAGKSPVYRALVIARRRRVGRSHDLSWKRSARRHRHLANRARTMQSRNTDS